MSRRRAVTAASAAAGLSLVVASHLSFAAPPTLGAPQPPSPRAGATVTPRPAATSAPPRPNAPPRPPPTPTEPAFATPERPLVSGAARGRLGKRPFRMRTVRGSIQTSGGFKIATLGFLGAGKERLQVNFMYATPGKVLPDLLLELYAVDRDGKLSAYRRGIGTCVVALELATETILEGTIDCPKGMLDAVDLPGKPITGVTFRAEADAS